MEYDKCYLCGGKTQCNEEECIFYTDEFDSEGNYIFDPWVLSEEARQYE